MFFVFYGLYLLTCVSERIQQVEFVYAVTFLTSQGILTPLTKEKIRDSSLKPAQVDEDFKNACCKTFGCSWASKKEKKVCCKQDSSNFDINLTHRVGKNNHDDVIANTIFWLCDFSSLNMTNPG